MVGLAQLQRSSVASTDPFDAQVPDCVVSKPVPLANEDTGDELAITTMNDDAISPPTTATLVINFPIILPTTLKIALSVTVTENYLTNKRIFYSLGAR